VIILWNKNIKRRSEPKHNQYFINILSEGKV
jgi:hypothetical protein